MPSTIPKIIIPLPPLPPFIQPEMVPPLTVAGGTLLIGIGLSFLYKAYQASIVGKMAYWSGLQPFGWWFWSFTFILSPFFTHLPPGEKNLIKWHTAAWVQLVFGPAFFLLSIMFLTAGTDFVGGALTQGNSRPGSYCMNWLLTFGKPGEKAIVYVPPLGYKFPIIKKARLAILELMCIELPQDKKQRFKELDAGDDLKQVRRNLLRGEDDEDEEEDLPPPSFK